MVVVIIVAQQRVRSRVAASTRRDLVCWTSLVCGVRCTLTAALVRLRARPRPKGDRIGERLRSGTTLVSPLLRPHCGEPRCRRVQKTRDSSVNIRQHSGGDGRRSRGRHLAAHEPSVKACVEEKQTGLGRQCKPVPRYCAACVWRAPVHTAIVSRVQCCTPSRGPGGRSLAGSSISGVTGVLPLVTMRECAWATLSASAARH